MLMLALILGGLAVAVLVVLAVGLVAAWLIAPLAALFRI